jgi:hypothetical protein
MRCERFDVSVAVDQLAARSVPAPEQHCAQFVVAGQNFAVGLQSGALLGDEFFDGACDGRLLFR